MQASVTRASWMQASTIAPIMHNKNEFIIKLFYKKVQSLPIPGTSYVDFKQRAESRVRYFEVFYDRNL